jgi:hypothetical protein
MRTLQGISSNKPRKARPFLPSLHFGNLLGLPRHGDPQGVRLAPGRQFLVSDHTHKTVKPPRPVAIYNILPRQPCFLSFLVKLSTRSSTKAIYLILPENNRTQFFAYQNKLGYLLPAESGSLVLPFDLRSLLSSSKFGVSEVVHLSAFSRNTSPSFHSLKLKTLRAFSEAFKTFSTIDILHLAMAIFSIR